MKDFSQRILAFAEKEGLWQCGQRILVACSGGPDSLALAYWFIQMQEMAGIRVALAYIHHHLRAAADAEWEFVKHIADKEGVPFWGAECDIPQIAKVSGKSIETAAREERYRLLYEIMRREGYERLAVAHHADDQAETVLHHVLRGTGIQGLRGMLPQRGNVIRPFLVVTRKEIESYLKTVPYTPCIDESNTDTTYLRNALRHEVLPVLAEINPQIRTALCRLADNARHDMDALQYWLQGEIKAHWEVRGKDLRQVERRIWNRWPTAVRRHCIRMGYAAYGKTPSHTMVEAMMRLAEKGRTGSRYAALGVQMVLTATHIRWQPVSNPVLTTTPMQSHPDATGEMVLDGVQILLRSSDTMTERALPQAAMHGMLRLRRRQAGDRIRLVYGTKKWKDWLIDHKIPREERDDLVLLADDRYVYSAYTPQGKQLVRAVPPKGDAPYWIPMERRRK